MFSYKFLPVLYAKTFDFKILSLCRTCVLIKFLGTEQRKQYE